MNATTTPLPLIKKGDRPFLHLFLFLATMGSAFLSFLYGQRDDGARWADFTTDDRQGAALFAISALTIMLAHELGHYILARHHGVDSSMPWFIPLPPRLTPFGTLGAVIRIRDRVPNKNALVDIGAAGPLAGLAIAIPVLVVGIHLSRIDVAGPQPSIWFGDTSLLSVGRDLYRYLAHGQFDQSARALFYGDNLLIIGLQYLIKGPIPPGQGLYAHPVLVAGWFGCLVTMLNLIPIGQLDGGHLTHAWFGDKAITLGKLMTAFMALMVLTVSLTWLVWMVLTALVVGFRHPPTVNPDEPLTRGRKVVCVICFIFIVLCLIPAPVQLGAAS
jgi:membrane-associated protease RseP (regulator of RpoE activity)